MNKKFFTYMGSKYKALSTILPYINKSNKKIYVEPFLGSGAVLLNLPKEFDEYHVAEKDHGVRNLFYHAIHSIKPGEITEFCNKLYKIYDFNKKEDYYKYRDKFNEKFYNTNTKSEALCLIVLIFNCINGMYRVGKNGFNQGFGNRSLTNRKLKKVEECVEYLRTISHKINLYNDYKHILCFRNALYFLDPPYYLTCNSNSSWNKKDTEHLFNNLNLNNNDVVYTDIENKYGDKFFRNRIVLNNIKYVYPKREHNKHKLNEMLYFNF